MVKSSYPEKWGQIIAGFFFCRWLASILMVVLLDICTWFAFKDMSGVATFEGGDKLLHILAFFVISIVGHLSLCFDLFPKKRHPALWIFGVNGLACMGYGVFIELVQMFLSHRSSSSADLAADAIGVLMGMLTVIFLKLYPRSEKPK